MRDLRALFDPRSVAILGASGTPGKWGYWLAANALKGKDARKIFLVNRSGQAVLGEPTYPSLADLPEPVELVVITIGAAGFESAVDDAIAAGARAVVAITAGLGEAGEAGEAAQRRAVARVRAAGAVLLGPNCLGVADASSGLNLSFGDHRPGQLALITQSGNLGLELDLLAHQAGLGFSRFVSVGNQADLEVAELIDDLVHHEPTRVIAAYVEDFRDGRELMRAALRAREAGRPVVLLTVGASAAGAGAALSHTGALVSSSVAVAAGCQAAGAILVATPRELIDTAVGLLAPSPPRGSRLVVVGDGGGHVALAADLASEAGLELPELSTGLRQRIGASLPTSASTRNPIDFAGGGEQDFHNYSRTVQLLAESGEVDGVLLTGYFGGYSEDAPEIARLEGEVATEMGAAVTRTDCALVVHSMYPASPTLQGLRAVSVPIYGDVLAAVQTLARLVAFQRQRPWGVPEAEPTARIETSRQMGYFGARRWLAKTAGLEFPEALEVTTVAEATAGAQKMGYPVVLKALGATHKSDAGGVRLNIKGREDLEDVWAELAQALAPETCSVERMVDGGADCVELLVGVRRDSSFGPVAVVGLGGRFAEILSDVAVALAPVGVAEAEAMIRSLKASPLLLGARGSAPLDVSAATRAVVAMSTMGAQHPEIADAEVNPLLVLRSGVVALDARVAGWSVVTP